MKKLSEPHIIETGLQETPPREGIRQFPTPSEISEESDDGWKSEDYSDEEEKKFVRSKRRLRMMRLKLPSIRKVTFKQGGPVASDQTKYDILCKSAAAKIEENRKKKNQLIANGKYYTREEEEIMEWYNIGPHVPTPPESMVNEIFHRNLHFENDMMI